MLVTVTEGNLVGKLDAIMTIKLSNRLFGHNFIYEHTIDLKFGTYMFGAYREQHEVHSI